ncbi:MAG: hypothetical protein IJE96_02550 [Mailhella sp.]|nr:hypothetical protein [Mailhella sp.]
MALKEGREAEEVMPVGEGVFRFFLRRIFIFSPEKRGVAGRFAGSP